MCTHAFIPYSIAEVQGLYGPLQILEARIHEVWALQQLQPGDWRTTRGDTLQVLDCGTFNRGAGPDFRDAVLRVNGEKRVGDIELHLYREDWWRHGHDGDPRYDRVLLHGVLFPGGMPRPIRTAAGSEPYEWVLAPWLREDLESLSGGEPGIFGERVPDLREWIAHCATEEVRLTLQVGADRRFDIKEGMAHALLQTHPLDEALHRLFLYYLGYPHDRRSFLAVAEAYPLTAWLQPAVVEEIRRVFADSIHWNWGRPLNRPLLRLRQYQRLVASQPDGCLQLTGLARRWAGQTGDCAPREAAKVWLREFAALMGAQLPGSLLNRLWIDAVLPLLTAAGLLPAALAAARWFHAPCGPMPNGLREVLQILQGADPCLRPTCNGWLQGLLWQEDQLRLQRLHRC